MLFNSLEFLIYLPILFIFYWNVLSKNLKLQNLFIVLASYVFYGWWDYRFLLLILFSTVLDYSLGRLIEYESNASRRKAFLWISIIVNLGFLGFFKYYNFFIDSFISAFTQFGYDLDARVLNIILPVGISFYTFQTLSYTIDVYRKKLNATNDFIAFAAFVSFFPQLVAGPIERATNLLPQFYKKRVFDYQKGIDGLLLITWGFFKKVAIADNLAPSVDEIFENYSDYSGEILILGAVLFAFQIYCDFSGYSNIARGLAKWFGFELMVNFNFPYFSRNIGEFWRRWHISLSTWFRDYIYIPLGGSRVVKAKAIRNVFIIFLVSGFWHGANWTFIAWGGLHAALFIPSFVIGTNRQFTGVGNFGENVLIPRIKEWLAVLYTFIVVTLAWVFFRSETVMDSLIYIKGMFNWYNHPPFLNPYDHQSLNKEFWVLGIFLFVEYLINAKKIEHLKSSVIWVWFACLALVVFTILSNPISQDMSFIYFQF